MLPCSPAAILRSPTSIRINSTNSRRVVECSRPFVIFSSSTPSNCAWCLGHGSGTFCKLVDLRRYNHCDAVDPLYRRTSVLQIVKLSKRSYLYRRFHFLMRPANPRAMAYLFFLVLLDALILVAPWAPKGACDMVYQCCDFGWRRTSSANVANHMIRCTSEGVSISNSQPVKVKLTDLQR